MQDGRKEIKMENQETKWRMNLQLFAEDAPDCEGDEPQGNGGSGSAAQTYTAEEVMKLIQHFVHLANAPIEDIKAAFSIVGNAHRYYAERRRYCSEDHESSALLNSRPFTSFSPLLP